MAGWRESGPRGQAWRRGEIAAGELGPTSRALYAIGICATPLLAAYHAAGYVSRWDLAHAPFALAGAWLGALAADLVTGAVHWACDTWGNERTRWVGAGLIHSFREHHAQPRAMLDHDWIEVNGQPAAAAAIAWAALLALPPAREWLAAHAFLAAFSWSLIAMAALANQIHQWSHHPSPPPWVRRLQRAGAILPPARHARHHRAPHATDYCITGGWMNRTLDAAGFWRALERAVTLATGAAPRANAESLSSIRIASRGGNR
jgi:ubiquitin-conjugating enzyme E2 variant